MPCDTTSMCDTSSKEVTAQWILKAKAVAAKYRFRQGRILAESIETGTCFAWQLSDRQRVLLQWYKSGKLREERNAAVWTYGCGYILNPDGSACNTVGPEAKLRRILQAATVADSLTH